MRSAHTTGSKYAETADLDITEIAKLVRQDIKAAQKAGLLPAGKYSVRCSRYSMGQSIGIRATLPGPDSVPASDPRSCAHARPDQAWREYTDTIEQANASAALRSILDAYNYDNSEVLSDYFEVRFSGDVTVRGAD